MEERSLLHINANLKKDISIQDKYLIKDICQSDSLKNEFFYFLIESRICGSFKDNRYNSSFCYVGFIRFEKPFENFDFFLDHISDLLIYYPGESNFLGFIKNDSLDIPEYLFLKKDGVIEAIDYKRLRRKPCKKKKNLTLTDS